MFYRARPLLAVIFLALVALPGRASAQSFGFGPRFSFVRGDLLTATPSTKFVGGTIRIQSSRHLVMEVGVDHRSESSLDGATRLRETPLQASLLLFPVRSRFAPYLLGGFGLYRQSIDTLDALGAVASTTTDKKTGLHLGLGAELFVSKHTAFFADYRFRFVKFGSPEADAEPIHIPGSSLIPGLKNVQLSHRGSMWTSGMALYF